MKSRRRRIDKLKCTHAAHLKELRGAERALAGAMMTGDPRTTLLAEWSESVLDSTNRTARLLRDQVSDYMYQQVLE